MSEYFKGGGGSQIPMLQIIRRQKLDKSGSKFRHGGEGYKKQPKKFRRLLWTAPNLTKFQLNQTTDTKNENNNCVNELNELKFFEVSRKSISNRC